MATITKTETADLARQAKREIRSQQPDFYFACDGNTLSQVFQVIEDESSAAVPTIMSNIDSVTQPLGFTFSDFEKQKLMKAWLLNKWRRY